MTRLLGLIFGLLLVLSSGCGSIAQAGGDHPHDAQGGHSHGADTHAHSPEPPDQSVTQQGEHSEIFVQFPALIKGRQWPFAVHLTRLKDFRPVTGGTVTVTLSGDGSPEETFAQEGARKPGLFRVVVTPQHGGLRNVTITLAAGDLSEVHDVGPYPVYPSVAEAIRSEPIDDAEENTDEISFSKEQQWRLDFRVTEVEARVLRPSIVANGILQPNHHGEAKLGAPRAGRLIAPLDHFPHLGAQVEKDQVLAILAVPFQGGTGDPASLDLAVERARVEYAAAEVDLARVEGLLAKGAIPARRVTEAASRKETAWAELATAKTRRSSFQAMQRSEGHGAAGRLELKAPVSGTVVGSSVVPGIFVNPGDELFHLVDLSRLWLEVNIPASQIFRVENTPGAWFVVEGSERVYEVGPESGGELIAIGGVVDPKTRTLPLVFEFPNPDQSLRVGMYARARVLTGPPREVTAIPREALADEEGKTVAYVQLDGETFERRVVTLGIRDGNWVEVLSGVEPGEALVTEGAYYVRLAAAGGAVPSHGHAH